MLVGVFGVEVWGVKFGEEGDKGRKDEVFVVCYRDQNSGGQYEYQDRRPVWVRQQGELRFDMFIFEI